MTDAVIVSTARTALAPEGEQVIDTAQTGQGWLGGCPTNEDSVAVQARGERRPAADDGGVVEHLRVLRHRCDAVDAPQRRSTSRHPRQG